MSKAPDFFSKKDRVLIVVAVALLAVPVLICLAYILARTSEQRDWDDTFFLLLIPMILVLNWLGEKLAKLDFWKPFEKHRFLRKILRERLFNGLAFVAAVSVVAVEGATSIWDAAAIYSVMFLKLSAAVIVVNIVWDYIATWWFERRLERARENRRRK